MEIDIKNYIESKIIELKGRLFPLFTTDITSLSVAYTFTPIQGGKVKQSQLQLVIIDSDYDNCKAIEKKIIKILDIQENEPSISFGSSYFRSSLSGGGLLFNDGIQRYEDTLIFTIKWRD